MIVTIAAALAAGLFVVGSYTLWARRQLRRTQGVFACRVRPAGPLEKGRWPRTRQHASWVHDVLIVRRGVTLVRCEPFGVANATGPIENASVRRMGRRPVQLRLHLDDGRMFDVVVRQTDAACAIGPFVVASLKSA